MDIDLVLLMSTQIKNNLFFACVRNEKYFKNTDEINIDFYWDILREYFIIKFEF